MWNNIIKQYSQQFFFACELAHKSNMKPQLCGCEAKFILSVPHCRCFISLDFNSKLPFKEVCPYLAQRSCQSTFNFLILLFITSLGTNWAEILHLAAALARMSWCYLLETARADLITAFGCGIWNYINLWDQHMSFILVGNLRELYFLNLVKKTIGLKN